MGATKSYEFSTKENRLYRTKKPTKVPVVVLLVVLQKFITLWLMIIHLSLPALRLVLFVGSLFSHVCPVSAIVMKKLLT